LLSKPDKKAKKDIVAMVIKDHKSNLSQTKKSRKNDKSDDEELYNLVRGKTTSMYIQQEGEDGFVPKKRV
jgi:hypothetical protein